MRRLTALMFLLLAVVVAATAAGGPVTAATAMTGLHVDGNRIRNGDGAVVRLHGVNRSSFQYACAEGWGIYEGPLNSAEVALIANWLGKPTRYGTGYKNHLAGVP